MTHVLKMPFDGTGADCRAGLNFTERGFGLRGAVGISDRANSAASKLKQGDIDWKSIFARDVPAGCTPAHLRPLSDTTPQVVLDALQAAGTRHLRPL
jgi:2-dehydro-3-deoxygluconokinase